MSATIAGEADRLGVFLSLADRRVMVVGGGAVATRKVEQLVRCAARPEVVAPELEPALHELVRQGTVGWRARRYAGAADLTDAWLVIAATDSDEVNAAVVADAEAARVWAINAGDAGGSPAWGAVTQRLGDGAAVAVSGGGDPRRARAIAGAVAQAVDAGELPTRRTRSGHGRVYLVGAGPGHEDLLTVRARRLLATADVVVMDRLAPWQALSTLADNVEVIDVGKAPGRHAMSQADINDLLVARARHGAVVVRLKGGDPFVLGRGGEEALACAAAGVPVEVVPGVTSAVAVPAAAGIPVTHRGVAASFAMVSAHSAEEALARASTVPADTTLVLLMGVRTLGAVATGLQAAGRRGNTPVAIVERGWQPGQRTTIGTLADIAERAEVAGVQSPAVVVIGDVVTVGQQIAAAPAEVLAGQLKAAPSMTLAPASVERIPA
jgi:uroporphyrin-III C-methyltransferase/precorrin-2 dehydrogenase/sirohydrochlorin ferrochelatase